MVLTRLMTAAELIELRDDGYHYELVRGELRRMPPPGLEHGEVVANAAWPFMLYSRQSGQATVFINDTGFWLEHEPDTVRGPDVAVVLNHLLPPKPWKGYAALPPTLALEVRSPSERLTAIEEKIDDYHRAGVPIILYLFPETRTVWVDGADRERTVLTDADFLDASDVLPGLEPIAIASFFD